MHGGYTEETTPPSKVNDTDEDESKEFIVHEPLSENLSMDVSESEWNIVNETLLPNNSSDVPTNVITELKYDEHIEPSVSDKGSSYLKYSSAVEIYCINWMLRINVHSQHPPQPQQYQKYFIKYLQHKRDSMI